MSGASLHHTEGHHSPIQHSKCACQFQCQRTLYVGPYAHRTDARSPVAHSSGTNGNLWRITSGLHNLSTQTMEILTKAVIGQVAPANQVPLVVLATRTSRESNPEPQKGWSWRPWTSKASKNGPNQSRSRPESCCLNGNTCLHAVTWTWAKLL